MLAAAEHGHLEGVAAVRRLADVEEHGGAPLPGKLVLADQELVVPRRRGPVDAAEVVAHDIGAQRVEVLTRAPERVGLPGPGERIVTGGVRERVDLVDVRVHGERHQRGGDGGQVGEAERVAHHHVERPDLHEAAPVGGEPVGGDGALTSTEGRHEQVGAAGARHGVAESEHGGAGGAQVADREVDAARGADVDACGVHRSAHLELEPSGPDEDCRADEQGRRDHPQGEELDESEHAAHQQQGGGAEADQPPLPGQHPPSLTGAFRRARARPAAPR